MPKVAKLANTATITIAALVTTPAGARATRASAVRRSQTQDSRPPGEAKISARAIATAPIVEGADGDHFRADIAEVVHTNLNEEATMLVVEWWTPTHELGRIERE